MTTMQAASAIHSGERAPPRVRTFRIPAMDCPVEEAELRRALEPIPGIHGLSFQLGPRTLAIDAAPEALDKALRAIGAAGFDCEPLPADGAGGPAARAAAAAPGPGEATGIVRLGAALALALGAEALHLFAAGVPGAGWAGLLVAAAAIALAGLDTYRKGINALVRGRLNINALMSVAVTGAFLIGQWPEAAMVMALFAIAERIEARAADRARRAIEGLLALAPEHAEVRQPDGRWSRVRAAEVVPGALVRLRPGQRVPLDGVVTQGRSTLDQAPITGESLPVERGVGDPVFAGTINQAGELVVRVTAAASDTTLARIVDAVERAQATRAPTQRFVDRFAAIYTPAVFALAVGVALALPLLFDAGWQDAVYKALVLLVVACPCALVISTPVTVVSALASAARRGILIKGGSHLEAARGIKVVALDKTGTLTEGRPRLVEWHVLAQGGAQDRERIGRIAMGLAARSDHPVSNAIAQGLALDAEPVDGFTALPGRGTQGRVAGADYVLGNRRLLEERHQCPPELADRLAAHERAGHGIALLAGEHGALALFAVADTIRPTSREAVAELRALGVATVLLSGDRQAIAETIAAQAGIERVHGDLLPEDKLAEIVALQRRLGTTAMTGDGSNDAPALAQADLGFAMGGAGTDIAMEAADVVVMNDDLRRIPETIRHARRTHAVLLQNIAFALGVKALFVVLALLGHATMWMAVFADMGTTLLVVGNGLRLLGSGTDTPRR